MILVGDCRAQLRTLEAGSVQTCITSPPYRGWLCHHCNLILGHAKDDSALLRKLADYLDRSTTTGDSA